MSRAYRSNAGNTFAKLFSFILVLLLILGAAGLIAYFVLQEKGVSFYVTFEDERYYSNAGGGGLELVKGQPYSFTVKSLTGEDVNYSVRITSNSANNFDFEFGDEYWQFHDTDETKNDYTEIFQVETTLDGFSLTVPSLTVEEIVEEQFGGDIELVNELKDDAAYFLITVTSGDSIVELWFNIPSISIELDQTAIIF